MSENARFSTQSDMTRALVAFIDGPLREVHGANMPDVAIEGGTPLFETGLIDSLAILDLLGFVEDLIDRRLRTHEVDMKHFGTVEAICQTFWSEARGGVR